MKGIEKHIEELEIQINELVNDLDNCSKDKAFRISEELDRLIDECRKSYK